MARCGTDGKEELIEGRARALGWHSHAEDRFPTVTPNVPNELRAPARHTHAGASALPVEPELRGARGDDRTGSFAKQPFLVAATHDAGKHLRPGL